MHTDPDQIADFSLLHNAFRKKVSFGRTQLILIEAATRALMAYTGRPSVFSEIEVTEPYDLNWDPRAFIRGVVSDTVTIECECALKRDPETHHVEVRSIRCGSIISCPPTPCEEREWKATFHPNDVVEIEDRHGDRTPRFVTIERHLERGDSPQS